MCLANKTFVTRHRFLPCSTLLRPGDGDVGISICLSTQTSNGGSITRKTRSSDATTLCQCDNARASDCLGGNPPVHPISLKWGVVPIGWAHVVGPPACAACSTFCFNRGTQQARYAKFEGDGIRTGRRRLIGIRDSWFSVQIQRHYIALFLVCIAYIRYWPNAGLMLAHRLRSWPNNNQTLHRTEQKGSDGTALRLPLGNVFFSRCHTTIFPTDRWELGLQLKHLILWNFRNILTKRSILRQGNLDCHCQQVWSYFAE